RKVVLTMLKNLTRREFIKTAAMGLLAFNAFGILPDEKAFAAGECTVTQLIPITFPPATGIFGLQIPSPRSLSATRI
ncbi:MAG: hypothetical protein K6E80_07285, partial [Schwartzia sp.]|nr:hypothetical protein [Schwartzia sp. (in: firmicutes)]